MKECPTCHRCFPDDGRYCSVDGQRLTFTVVGDPVLEGRYELWKRLGEGGMGMVYKARHILLKTTHAIKVILPELVGNDPSFVTRFRQEAMAAAAIRHHNVIAVTDYGVAGGKMPFLVMEYIKGKSLNEVLTEEGKLTPERALDIMEPIAAGIGAAHRRGIVHRDLKPLNIMIEDELPMREAVKVLDFGLAKIKSGELLGSFVAAKTTGLMGSPYYMAPEQWSDEEPEKSADIYSLGIILYQMLAGEVPFKGPSLPSIMKKHLMEPPPRFAELGAQVPSEIEDVVRHALEKAPDARPHTVQDFFAELRDAVAAARRRLESGQAATLAAADHITRDQLAGTISDSKIGKTIQEAAAEARRQAEEEARRREEEAARQQEAERQRAAERAARLAEEARLKREEEERLKREEESRLRREEEARLRREEEARLAREEEEARRRREAEEAAARVAEAERLRREEEEARQRAEEEARLRAEEEARQRAAEEAAARAAEEARLKREEEERLKREEEERLRAEQERLEREEEARRAAEAERLRLEYEEGLRRAEEEQRRAEEERKKAEEEEARRLAEEMAARQRAAEEAARLVEQARLKREEEERLKLEEEARLKREEEQRLQREQEQARLRAEEEARRRAEEEAAARAAEEARLKREEEERLKHEEEERLKLQEEARLRREREERLKREEEQRLKREEEARLRREEEERVAREEAARRAAEEAAARRAEAERLRREEEERQAAELRRRREEEEARKREEEESRRQAEEQARQRERARRREEEEERRRRAAEAEVEVEPVAAGHAESIAPAASAVYSGPAVQEVGLSTPQGDGASSHTEEPSGAQHAVSEAWAPSHAALPPVDGDAAGRKRNYLPFVAGGAVALVLLLVAAAALVYQTKRGEPSAVPAGNTSKAENSNAGQGGVKGPGAKPSPTADMVAVGGGTFRMGRDDVDPASKERGKEYPAHAVPVKAFSIDRTEVTNAEYAEFVRATGHPAPRDDKLGDKEAPYWKPWTDGNPPAGQELWPVRNVSLKDAETFAAWRSQRDGVTYRLPTEEEWEFAARSGGAHTLYPWGDNWVDGNANVDAELPQPVGSRPAGATTAGALDMIGNVWEWTSSLATVYPGNDKLAIEKGGYVIRGGSYQSKASGDKAITATSRVFVSPTTRHPTTGFRLVRPGP